MTLLEALRVVWTVSTGIGALIMLYLLREVWIDDHAIGQVRPPRADFLRVHTRGEVWDQAILTIKALLLFLAGVLAITLDGPWPIPPIVLSAGLLVLLGVFKFQRRRRIFRTLRLNREAK
jgi:hypothetical protein